MRKYASCLALLFGLTFLFSVLPAFSQTTQEFKALKKEIDALKAGQAAIKKDIQGLKKNVKLKPAAAPGGAIKNAIVNIKGAPIKGDKHAKLVFIEFSDYQ